MENKEKPGNVISNEVNLSKREIEIINLIADGFDYKQIAEKLFLSPDTISSHKKIYWES